MADLLKEIIEFAIEREKEAAQFYGNLQKMSHFAAQADTLREFEQMEKAHIEYLRTVDNFGLPELSPEDVPDLKISEFVVEGEITPGMSYGDLVAAAMKREEKSAKLYEKLAVQYKNQDAKDLFTRLAAEESAHKLHFEKIYEKEVFKDS